MKQTTPSRFYPIPPALAALAVGLLTLGGPARAADEPTGDEAAAEKNRKPALTFSRFPSRFRSSQPLTPTPNLLLRFSQPVSPEEVSRHVSFVEETGTITVPAEARRPTPEEVSSLRRIEKPSLAYPDRSVLIRPASQLSVGKNWKLRTRAGLTSTGGSHVIHQDSESTLGKLSPFVIHDVLTENPYDTPMSIVIEHSKSQLSPLFGEGRLEEYIDIDPRPENFTATASSYAIRLNGDFDYGVNYKVTVKAGIIAYDRLQLQQQTEKEVIFEPNRGFVGLPLFSATQNASGAREFEVQMANLDGVRTRVKRLDGDHLIFAMKGYEDAYEGHGDHRTIPYAMVPGKTIYDETTERTAEIDHTETFKLSWNEIDPESDYGSYYVCTEGESDTRRGATMGAQALVQVTDIGLAWKQNEHESLFYAFSVREGHPLPNVSLRLVTSEAEEVLSVSTGDDGIARIGGENYREKKELWLDATLGDDRHLMAFSGRMNPVGLWSFGIPYRHGEAAEGERRTLIFTDRDVYKPGETVFLKAISRPVDSDRLLPPGETKATLRITDPRGRTLVDRQVEFGPAGSFDTELALPETGLGYHSIRLDFNDPEGEEDHDWRKVSYHSFNVAEYRVNSFEVSLDAENRLPGNTVTVPVSAKYYMGKPLSKAVVTWSAFARKQYPRPPGFEEFTFGDELQGSSGFSENDTLQLSGKGTGTIEFDLPVEEGNPGPRQVSLRAEVTDVNQQTISGNSSFTVHSSDFYIGLRKPEGVYRAGDSVPFMIANTGTDGKAHTEPVDAAITIQKEIWNTVKVKGSDGKIVFRNDRQLDLRKHENLALQTRIDPDSGLVRAETHHLTFNEAGDYIITLESVDEKGRLILTREKFRVIGAEEPSWARYDVVRIDVIPDRKSYRVGDTAKLLVRSPVFGHALLTTERGEVKSTETFDIRQPETIVEVPIRKGSGPNLFASVLVIRGSGESPHKHPAADYRLGYCQLDVEDPGDELKVTLESGDEEYYEPGQQVEVTATITDAAGAPVSGAEVTLFAVDEGILSLTGYETPAPGKVFHAPFPLGVTLGQSLSALFPENPLERDFGNKGYVIGGGGFSESEGLDRQRVRKDFKALAFWEPALKSGPDGKVTHRFAAPDNLTAFRLMAVVADGNRFGHADKPVVINKPLIIEPALPEFSNLSDRLDVTAVLHNNTDVVQDVEVNVELDEHAVFLKKVGDPIPTSLPSGFESALTRTRELSINPGDTETLHFPVGIVKTGEAVWRWKVRSMKAPQLADVTESRIPVGYPLPLLRATEEFALRDSGETNSLLDDVSPRLLNGRGTVEVRLSNSRLIEASDAIDYLLRYPYGCVEQTTSTTIPWLSTQNLRRALPTLNRSEEEIDRAVVKGTRRLLAMQTREGGLGYWPGDDEPVLWGSAYGGLALALAQRNGVALDAGRLDSLWNYLSQSLRDTAKISNAYDLSQRCLAVYTLALAGKPEPGYHEVLYQKLDSLPREARHLLALAILESSPDDDAAARERVESLLTAEPGDAESGVAWYRSPYLKATELMAWSRFRSTAPKTDELLSELMKLRSPGSGWGSTYSNAWPILALSHHSDRTIESLGSNRVTLRFGEETAKVRFGSDLSAAEFKFPFDGDRRELPLTLELDGDSPVYAQVSVATQPELQPMQPENKGFGVHRKYEEVDIEGNLKPADDLMVGDLVLVTLDINVPEKDQDYVAIDDPLPAILEAINPNFTTRNTRRANQKSDPEDPVRRLSTSFRELRKDRTLFFANRIASPGDYRVQYLARVVAPGNCIAPPTKVEAMYEPERFGLSGTQGLSAKKLTLDDELASVPDDAGETFVISERSR